MKGCTATVRRWVLVLLLDGSAQVVMTRSKSKVTTTGPSLTAAATATSTQGRVPCGCHLGVCPKHRVVRKGAGTEIIKLAAYANRQESSVLACFGVFLLCPWHIALPAGLHVCLALLP